MLCLLLHATISDIDECADPSICGFSYLQNGDEYRCVNVPGEYHCVLVSSSISNRMSRDKIIIIGMSFYPLRSTIIEKRFTLNMN